MTLLSHRGLLLDRDGVINTENGYVHSQDAFSFTPQLFPFLRAAQDNGWKLAIVTNQSGVAHAMYTKDDYHQFTNWILGQLRREGIDIASVFQCFYYKDGVLPEYSRCSFWRKPNPGMILEASARLDLDLSRSAMIGDRISDMQAATAAYVGTKLLMSQSSDTTSIPTGTVIVADFAAAAKQLGFFTHPSHSTFSTANH